MARRSLNSISQGGGAMDRWGPLAMTLALCLFVLVLAWYLSDLVVEVCH